MQDVFDKLELSQESQKLLVDKIAEIKANSDSTMKKKKALGLFAGTLGITSMQAMTLNQFLS